jgi:tetratricopeptide (TPR) repeat protein
MNEEREWMDRLVWIDLPDDADLDLGVFTIDPSVPLPLEMEEDGEVNLSDVTWEKVIAAMLLVLANSPSHEHAAYYRRFLNALRPELSAQLDQACRERLLDKDWNSAEDIALAMRGLEPEEARPRRVLAGLYAARAAEERKKGDPATADSYEASAEAAYSELLSDDAAPGEVWFEAGTFRYGRGDFLRAAETLESYLDFPESDAHRIEAERLIRLCREDGQADELYRSAYAALTAGKVDEGTAMAREFRDRNPSGWPGWFILGWALRLSENWQEARESLEGARDRGCREGSLYNELAICTRALGDYDASAANLEDAVRLDPENTRIMSNMAIVQLELGREDEAVRWLETALTIDPTDTICRRLLDDLTPAE